jgi:hypothetical protein
MGLAKEITSTEICRKRGDTYPIEITVKDKKTGLVLDVTGNTFTLSVSEEDAPIGAAYAFQSTGTITDAVNGVVEFAITASDANRVGVFYFDVEMAAGTIKTTILGGTFSLFQDITK